jgi:D-alanyl-D-alanine carboxypeptidase/D-alanyl-D-alanine-endopeptidase (penicillin-binding protein 4)
VTLTACATPASDASPTTLARHRTTTSTTEATTTTSTTTVAVQLPPVPPSTTSTTAPTLVGALDAVWAATPKSSCLMVQNGATVVYERNPDLPVTPASTLKLLTATAALAHLDPASRLRTRLVSASAADLSGTVNGDVYLVGGGDPLLATGAFAGHFTRPRLQNRIEPLADRLRAAGVRHITGRLLGDDSRYDAQRYQPSWPASYRTEHEAGPLSALLVNDGAASWSPHREVPVADAALAATETVAQLLRDRGITIDGGLGIGRAPATPVELAGLDSPTIGEIVGEMLLDSNNNAAELLLKELGVRVLGQGTTDAGREVVLDTLTRMGLPMNGVRMVDASGLDRGDRVTCRLLTALLTNPMVRGTIGAGLPVATRTGTLWHRFAGTAATGRLRAKTGSLNGVAGLAGYVSSLAGAELTFAFEQVGVGDRQGDTLQDRLGTALVTAR